MNHLWAVVPAAGIGKRMRETIPKQYLSLSNKPILEHTLHCLLSYSLIRKVVLVVAENDQYWPSIVSKFPNEQIIIAFGGEERCHSVLQGLHALSGEAHDEDWVLVHDAVRPCISHQDLDHLVDQLADHAVGGLLGVPVKDTLKYLNESGLVLKTIDRANTWQAQTPQMFRFKSLQQAIQHTIETEQFMTDEAGAIELMGYRPKMIMGRPENIKVTEPQDLLWMERYWSTLAEETY